PENVVVQWLTEWGPAVSLLAAGGIAFALRPPSGLARSQPPVGAWAAIAAAALHNLVGFSLAVPAGVVAPAVFPAAVTRRGAGAGVGGRGGGGGGGGRRRRPGGVGGGAGAEGGSLAAPRARHRCAYVARGVPRFRARGDAASPGRAVSAAHGRGPRRAHARR